MFCREQVARAAGLLDTVRSLGAEMHALGNGTVAMARDFVEQFGVRFPVYTDPSLGVYREAGMKRKFGLGLGTLLHARRALGGGHRQGRILGDTRQQGGALLITRSGRIAFRHVDDGAGEHADLEAMVAALRTLGD